MGVCDFGWALNYLKAGLKVRRKGWNGKGMWLELQMPDENSKMTEPYIFLDYPNPMEFSRCRIPWLASQADVLGEDWEVVEP